MVKVYTRKTRNIVFGRILKDFKANNSLFKKSKCCRTHSLINKLTKKKIYIKTILLNTETFYFLIPTVFIVYICLNICTSDLKLNLTLCTEQKF